MPISHEHKPKPSEKYVENGKLEVLVNEILTKWDGDELADAETFQWKILFTNGSLGDEEVAGKCRKIDGPIRYLWGVDYLLLIHKPSFDAGTPREKTRILVHELHHIAQSENGEPQIRKHAGDFCSIPEHDKLSYRIAEAIYRKLDNLSEFLTQEELPVPIVS